MDTLFLYLICFIPSAIIIAAYLLCRYVSLKNKDNKDKILRLFLKIFAIVTFAAIFLAIFHNQGAMVTGDLYNAQGDIVPGQLDPNKGCVNLVGVPYGENKAGNFFAWLSIAMFYGGSIITTLLGIWEFKAGKIINKFIHLPVVVIEAATLFNFINATRGECILEYRSILLAIEVGFSVALSVIEFFEFDNDIKKINWKEILYAISFYLIIWLCSIPSNTAATLFPTNFPLFGAPENSWRFKDFSQLHRIILYVSVIFPTIIYFVNRGQELNARKVIAMAASIGALFVFFEEFSAYNMFPLSSDGTVGVSVTSLPIHLCHTALYVVPICIAFNLKRLFYFTYFINVFGALMAMFFPNTGADSNIFAPSVAIYWYNHISAFAAPLICVALGIFEKPKFKQMLWSLLFFAIYFVIIMFLNAWLSIYVKGYDPNVIGSGTDYLFINGDYILTTVFGEESTWMLNIKLIWEIGGKTCVVYPLYQSLFFIVYVAVAFGMRFVYSLFFRIADSHIELHNKLMVARTLRINFKERLEMEKINNNEIDHSIPSLKFENFSKRYGASKKLSANNVNLEVHGGEIFGFLGPNGAGKSTCIKTTIGIQPVTEGHIYVCGYDVTTQSVKAKKCIGYVPDHYALYEKLTGREYINYIADLYGVSKEDRDARIAKYVDLFELNQAFDNRMQTYSHGMKQKMTIIAALVHDPKVWILDEPLTGLDPQSIYQVKECMKAHAAKGNIVFFSSHLIDVVEKLCTRIAVIKKGQIVYVETMEKLLEKNPNGLEQFYMDKIRDNGDLDEQ